MKVIVRPVTKQDKGIVFSTWLKGNYFGCKYFNEMDQDLYFKEYGQYIQDLLDKPGTKVDVAVFEDAPTVDVGYIVYNDQTLYWAYTKRQYRKQGIFNILIQNMDFVRFTGSTPVGLAIGKKKQLEFNPIGDK